MNYIKRLHRFSNGKPLADIGAAAGVGTGLYRWDKIEPRLTSLVKVADVLGIDYRLLLPDQDELLKQAKQHATKGAKAND